VPKSQYFRAGAGVIIVNSQGLVLAIERAGFKGAWQLPQGGLARSEEPLHAAYREAEEETGLRRRELTFVRACSEPLVYELPAGNRRAKTGRGQVLYWFLFRFRGTDNRVDVTRSGEARGWRWMPMRSLTRRAVSFRRPMYRRLEAEFTRYLVAGNRRRTRRAD
jgi:putative (di)nucleoside polyphosphate hydrolase